MDLREFLYVDVERTRSFLSQLDEGVVLSVVKKTQSAVKGGLAAKILGVGATGELSHQSGKDESKSLQDLTYVLFEQSADVQGVIHEMPEACRSVQAWESGEVHAQLQPSEIVRATCDIQIVDPEFFAARLARVNEIAEAVVQISLGSAGSAMPKHQREGALRKARTAVWGSTEPEILTHLSKAMTSFLGGSIAVRIMACGPDRPELGFSGALLGRREYIQEEREALFSRYGVVLHDWTAVMQIATVPLISPATPTAPGIASFDLTNANNQLKRASLEGLAAQFIALMDTIGVSEGPRWPSVSVIPLAIYRTVPDRAVQPVAG